MATWDDLTRSKKMQLARQLAAGKNDPENINRAMDILANNPDVLKRVAKEAGVEDEIDALDEMSVEDNIDKMFNKKIPTPKSDETIRDYVARLQREIDKVDRGEENDSFEDSIFGQSKKNEGEL